jgi:hypothetical protein
MSAISTQSGSADAKDWVATAFEVADNGPPSALALYLSDSIEMRFGNGETLRGKEAVLKALSAPSPIKSVRHVREALVMDANSAVQLSTAHYTLHNGKVVSIPVATYFRRDARDLIDRAWIHIDFTPVIAAAATPTG